MKLTKLNSIWILIFLAMLLVTITACDSTKQVAAPPEMVGNWVGLGHHLLSSEFLDQKEIPMMLTIDQQGNISGYLGDAGIVKTGLQKTAWWLRLLSKEKYRAVVELRGNIVNQESFKRDGGTIFFESLGTDEMICGFTSTGSKVNSENMALPVKDIKLRHAN